MTFNTLHFVVGFFKYLGIAIAILLTGTTANIKAQEDSHYILSNNLNGLFVPNASQIFFEAGRENLKKEQDFLNNSEYYLNKNILQIDPELLQEIEKEQEFFNLEGDVDFKLEQN